MYPIVLGAGSYMGREVFPGAMGSTRHIPRYTAPNMQIALGKGDFTWLQIHICNHSLE
jgi:hypothetical protein